MPGASSRSPERGIFLRAFFAKNSSLRVAHGYAKSEAMPTDPQNPLEPEGQTSDKRPLPPVAERALAEAAARRAERDRNADQSKESGGRGGLDPTRYGDWEKDGLISDF
jgi:hypothetical protein